MRFTPTHDLSNEEYHAHPAISRSALKLIERSPLHYWHRFYSGQHEPAAPTPAMEFGTAVHSAVLEPDLFSQTYAQAPELAKTTRAGKEAWAEATAGGKHLLTKQQLIQIAGIQHALDNHDSAKRALTADGINEASFVATCPTTGLEIKCRPDRLLASGTCIDLKTTQDASASAFSKAAFNLGYHIQAAFYLKTLELATGITPKGFVFLTVEKDAPHGVQVFKCSDDMLAFGGAKVDELLAEIAKCIETFGVDDPWPGYAAGVSDLQLPTWATR